jgi:hypothetical protein
LAWDALLNQLLFICALPIAASPTDIQEVCKLQADNHGCCNQCGYTAVYAGETWICMPEGKAKPFPFTITEDDKEEQVSPSPPFPCAMELIHSRLHFRRLVSQWLEAAK